MEAKDYVLAAGVAVTLFLGIWNAIVNHSVSNRTIFINTVTSQRIKWIEQLRQDIGAFCSLTYHWVHTNIENKHEEGILLKEVDRLRHVIRLRLNPEGEHDKAIAELVEEIPRLAAPEKHARLVEALNQMTRTTQLLLKDEWEKVKRESKHGPLSDRA
jgi:hypothetical protein